MDLCCDGKRRIFRRLYASRVRSDGADLSESDDSAPTSYICMWHCMSVSFRVVRVERDAGYPVMRVAARIVSARLGHVTYNMMSLSRLTLSPTSAHSVNVAKRHCS